MASMNMRQNLIDIYKVFSKDETLLRLLYYKPANENDSPLSTDKENILDKTISEKWEIIKDKIKTTMKVDDLDKDEKCRILITPGKRLASRDNYLTSTQYVRIDIVVHISFDETDFRLAWICDRINELINNSRITGNGHMLFDDGDRMAAPAGYVAYCLKYKFGSFNQSRS